jgi:membrane-bound metal-dependent hydrolase YbcI (DUF457 family)
MAWTLYGLVTSQLGNVSSKINVSGSEIEIRQYLAQHFGFHHSFLPYVAVWYVGMVLLFGLVFAYSIKFINFQRR